MSLWQSFLSWFDTNGSLDLSAIVSSEYATEIYYKELAIQACVNLIANTVARSEFRTYEKGKEVKKDNYYLLNVEPNPNKSASKFWRDVISKLVYDNECLVIQQNDRFYVADSFATKRFAFKDYLYTDIVIDDYFLRSVYLESDVLHFELHNDKVRTIIEGLYQSYAKLIAAAQKKYIRSAARKGKLTVPANYPQTEKAQKDLRELLERKFRVFYESDSDAVIPLTGGQEFEELASNQSGARGSVEGRDIRAFVDDVFDYVAIAFQVPPQLLKGNVADTEKAVNNFLTFCINPLAELLTDEINRKMYGRENYLKRTYMQLDTSHIRAVDIKDVANALDVLVRIGAYSVDDCLKHLGMEPQDTDWSRARWMTKNYTPIEEALKGGDGD